MTFQGTNTHNIGNRVTVYSHGLRVDHFGIRDLPDDFDGTRLVIPGFDYGGTAQSQELVPEDEADDLVTTVVAGHRTMRDGTVTLDTRQALILTGKGHIYLGCWRDREETDDDTIILRRALHVQRRIFRGWFTWGWHHVDAVIPAPARH